MTTPLHIGVLLLSVLGTAREDMPPAPTQNLAAEFPACPPPYSLGATERCRSDLEGFRSGPLEGYNGALKAYSEELGYYDAALRQKAQRGKLTWDLYEDAKNRIDRELRRVRTGGDLMRPYTDYAARYAERILWVTTLARKCRTSPVSCR